MNDRQHEQGAATAEYAVGAAVGVGFAATLVSLVDYYHSFVERYLGIVLHMLDLPGLW